MKTILFSVVIVTCLLACNTKRSDNQFDSNAAEASNEPGDLQRKNGDTNEEAAQRAERTTGESKGQEHPALKDVGDSVGVVKPSFATKAADMGLTEVHLAELAVHKTKDESIKHFAELMLKDHAAANEELKKLAASKNITLPAECMTCAETYKELHDLGTDEFNERYSKLMVDDHERAVKLFGNEAANSKDPDLKKWAGQKLPTLKHHYRMATEMMKKDAPATAKTPKQSSSKKKSK
ncbi:MAG TPA: DUF4142 domain-containing protein [Cyclobacteriaceae bacterium]|nr:DUF4142 domain-containing protein [Cyclobacteriaceae bacterium]